MKYPYTKIAVGGTFDHLHQGHERLLHTAFQSGRKIEIGLTQKTMLAQKKLFSLIQNYHTRHQALVEWLKTNHYFHRSSITPLSDLYGPTLTDQTIKALAVTPHTISGALQINSARAQRSLPKLPIIQAELVKDQSGIYLSSTRIRQGLVSRQGFVYFTLVMTNHTLTSAHKQILAQPQGLLLTSLTQLRSRLTPTVPIALVGDYITQWFIDHKLPFNYAIFDGFNRRQPFTLHFPSHIFPKALTAKNPRGTISKDTANAINKLIQKPYGLLHITGEEDLTALPLALELPLYSHIFYGQPGQGIVMIEVTEAVKERYAQLLLEQ